MASSSSSVDGLKYDVFLSFRGADTRYNFTSHLYNALCKEGVNAFMDKELKRGEEISSTLFRLIESSKISIVVFSQNYAASEFCLDELVKILECRASAGQIVLPVFYGVDPIEVEKQTGSYSEAFSTYENEFKEPEISKTSSNVKETIKEKMEKVRRWRAALAETADLAGWDLHHRDEAEIVQHIVKSVLEMLNSNNLGGARCEGDFALDASQTSNQVFPERRLVGGNFEIYKRDIWEWITADVVSSIGIWGMGGVGKTTLLIQIYNTLLDKEAFGQVYWVTVSKDFTVYKLQNLIAEVIQLEFGTEKDPLKRAAKLLKALTSKGKFVLILDDLWSHFEMKKVGIPFENYGCKLIITTRSKEVCTRIGLQMLKKIEPLSEEDAWDLFEETIGHDLAENIRPVAKNVARECCGLPLGIVTMAGSMRDVDDIHEWNYALTELQRSEVRPDDMKDEVFSILRFSYTSLKDDALQQCLLYCALFPEDYKIRREELIDFLIAEGIIKQQMRRQMDFDKGHTMLNKLVKVSLLEDLEKKYKDRYVQMHDLIRDMCIQIMKESCSCMIEAGRQLEQVPEEKDWTEGIMWVSLLKNDIDEIPSKYSPRCSTLSTLLLSRNEKLKSIPYAFFLHFPGLKVLDLSYTWIEMLPESVGYLQNLKGLWLTNCIYLHSIPSLGKLTSLEMLDLKFCRVLEQVPEGLELCNLKCVNLIRSGIKKLPSGMLARLSRLQFLAFCSEFEPQFSPFSQLSYFSEVEVLAGLQKLESLIWRFYDFSEFKEYARLVSNRQRKWQITNYFLHVGELENSSLDRPSGRELSLNRCLIDRELFVIKNLQSLLMENATIHNGSGLCLQNHSSEPELMILEIKSCEEMKYLFHLSSSPSILGNLKTLTLARLGLRALFGQEAEEPLIAKPLVPCASTFCSLRVISIYYCNNMKSLCSPTLFSNFCNLEEITIALCSEMEEIVAATADETSCGHNPDNSTETSLCNLSKLKSFELAKLPNLKRICNEQIVCDSLEKLVVIECNELMRIPMSLPLLSLQHLKVWPEEWWESVHWDNPVRKSALQPQFVSFKYLRKISPTKWFQAAPRYVKVWRDLADL